MDLSVVIPVFNEEGNIQPLIRRLLPALENAVPAGSFEIIFVNDGSSDGSVQTIRRCGQQDSRIKLLSFSRNFGHQIALTAGMDRSSGRAVICLDADLQHPPELIPNLVEKWREGFEIVYTVRKSNADAGFLKRFTSFAFYRFFKKITRIQLEENTADFRLLDRKVVNAFLKIRERSRFLRGLTAWIGFKSYAVNYDAEERHSGQSKYSFKKMLRFSVEAVVSFSSVPLYFSLYIGLFFSLVAMVYSGYVIFEKFVGSKLVPGWSSLIIFMSLIGGLQLIMLGLNGVYLAKIYDEVKQRPLYLISEELGFQDKDLNT